MRKMKGSSNYLKNQVRKNLAKAVLCIALFFLILFALGLRVLFTLSLSIFDGAGFLVSLVPLAAFYFYLRKYRIYNAGWVGEKRVAKLLSSKLSDDYFLINDLYLHEWRRHRPRRSWSKRHLCFGDKELERRHYLQW